MSPRGLLIAGTAAITLALSSGAEAQTFGAPIQDLNLRVGPGTGYGVVAVMPAGASVTIHQCSGGWCQVTYAGRSGWASQRYLDMQVAYAPGDTWVAGAEPVWGGAPAAGFELHVGPRPYYRDWDSWRRPGWYAGWHEPDWWYERPAGWYGPVYWDRSRWWHDDRWHVSPGFALGIGFGW